MTRSGEAAVKIGTAVKDRYSGRSAAPSAGASYVRNPYVLARKSLNILLAKSITFRISFSTGSGVPPHC